ncbi:MAG: TonB-dependent receptor [Gammaproteobacteria bacterium]|nr:TonB-dependent receptor [Gammaproteobacteria bacterium]
MSFQVKSRNISVRYFPVRHGYDAWLYRLARNMLERSMSTRTVSGYLSILAFAFLLLGFPASAQEETESESASEDESEMEQMTVIGVRNPDRSVAESTASIQVIGASELDVNGSADLLDQLAMQVPALHVERFPIADAATLIRPLNLRGLPSDSTLVLVNGKRRHRGAVVALLAGGKNAGSQGPDIAAIPSIALDRVEVLRDGATAQYGSDAIAGVVNFVLKRSNSDQIFQYKMGQYFQGDGNTQSFAGLYSFPLTSEGFVTLSMELHGAGTTSRSVQRDDALGLIAAQVADIRQPAVQVWGSPEIDYDRRFFANSEMNLGENSAVYAFGNYSARKVEGGFFYRNPATRAGVFTADGGQTLLVADFDLEDGQDCPVVPIVNLIPDEFALSLLAGSETCYTFYTNFPGGFTPQFGGEIVDQSLAVGLRGVILGDWDFDVSLVTGYSGVTYFMYNTINPQLIEQRTFIPTSYKPGQHEETDTVFNYEMAKMLEVASGMSDVYFATGFEYRTEQFTTTRGEENSWMVVPDIAAQGFGIGSNGFPGFPPSAEVDESRSSYALWVDAEQEFTSNILSSLAVRYESYEDFGQTLDFKFATRIEYTPNFSVRGAFSTGFRAPTAGQANIRNVSTNFLISPICAVPNEPCLTDEVTLSPTDPLSELKGGEVLQPVRSRNLTSGITYNKAGFDIEFEYFRIDVDDRIARTSPIPVTPADIATLEARGQTVDQNLSAISFYTNDFDTRTEGLELNIARSVNWGRVQSNFNLVANYTVTTVEHFNPDIINSQRVRELEEAIPRLRYTIAGTHQFGRMWTGMTRVRYYGEFWEPHVFSDVFPIDVEAAALLDVEISFTPDEQTALVIGFENLLDTYPTENPYSGVVGAQYPITSPFGFNGALGYFRMTFYR